MEVSKLLPQMIDQIFQPASRSIVTSGRLESKTERLDGNCPLYLSEVHRLLGKLSGFLDAILHTAGKSRSVERLAGTFD